MEIDGNVEELRQLVRNLQQENSKLNKELVEARAWEESFRTTKEILEEEVELLYTERKRHRKSMKEMEATIAQLNQQIEQGPTVIEKENIVLPPTKRTAVAAACANIASHWSPVRQKKVQFVEQTTLSKPPTPESTTKQRRTPFKNMQNLMKSTNEPVVW